MFDRDRVRQWHWELQLLYAIARLVVGLGIMVVAILYIGSLAGHAMVLIIERFGPVLGLGFAVLIVAALYSSAFRSHRRAQHAEYGRARTITIESTKPTPTWAKVALWIQGAGLVFFIVIMIMGGT